MGNDDADRFLVLCTDCGAAFAGMTVSNGEIQAIGCRNGCPSCGNAEFAPVSAPSEATGVEAAPSDD